MPGFIFPRTHSFGAVDDGLSMRDILSRNGFGLHRCPHCNSSNFRETVSTEECFACAYAFDYWGLEQVVDWEIWCPPEEFPFVPAEEEV